MVAVCSGCAWKGREIDVADVRCPRCHRQTVDLFDPASLFAEGERVYVYPSQMTEDFTLCGIADVVADRGPDDLVKVRFMIDVYVSRDSLRRRATGPADASASSSL